MILCKKCGSYLPDESLKCEKCGATIVLTKEQFLENHTIYKKKYKYYNQHLNGMLIGILCAVLSILIICLMIVFAFTTAILPCLIATALSLLLAVYGNKKRMDIKKFGNDEYEKYLNSQKNLLKEY